VTALAISPDEKTVATAGSDGHVYLFNTQDGKQTGTLDSHDGYTFDLAWSVDGASLSGAGSDGVIRQWQLGNSNAAEAVAQQSQSITGIDFSANGKYLASSSFNGDVVIRDANSFAKVQRIRAYPGSAYSVSMTGDGRFVAAAGGVNFIRVWRR
jgi:WD40 repeat protein